MDIYENIASKVLRALNDSTDECDRDIVKKLCRLCANEFMDARKRYRVRSGCSVSTVDVLHGCSARCEQRVSHKETRLSRNSYVEIFYDEHAFNVAVNELEQLSVANNNATLTKCSHVVNNSTLVPNVDNSTNDIVVQTVTVKSVFDMDVNISNNKKLDERNITKDASANTFEVVEYNNNTNDTKLSRYRNVARSPQQYALVYNVLSKPRVSTTQSFTNVSSEREKRSSNKQMSAFDSALHFARDQHVTELTREQSSVIRVRLRTNIHFA